MRLGRCLQESDEFADGVVSVLWVAEGKLEVDVVMVAPADARPREVAGLLEFVDDLGGGALGDADLSRDVSKPSVAVGRNGCEDVPVIGHEPPCMIAVSST
ncbi:MAG: hypothetical protein QOK21_4085 [Solirubrobacteraceae bacterium]|nr:hypothetical protein [Solirubrobacteraceae bacterium]